MPAAGLRYGFKRVEAGRGRGQQQGESAVVLECSSKVTGRGAMALAQQVAQRLDQLAGPVSATDGFLSWAWDSDWRESVIFPTPRGEIPLMVDRLVAG
eukprot:3551156-Alexandrium_andersonii.AAC.1